MSHLIQCSLVMGSMLVQPAAEQHKLPGQFAHDKQVQSVRYLPDGKTLVTSTRLHDENWNVQSICFWNAQTGGLLYRQDAPHGETDNCPTSFTWCLSPDGKTLARFSENSATIELHELATGKKRSINGQPHGFSFVEFTADSARLVTVADADRGPIRIYDAVTTKLVHHLPAVAQADFTPFCFDTYAASGKFLVAIGYEKDNEKDKTWGFRIWDLRSNGQACKLENYSPEYITDAFSPDGKMLATVTVPAGTKKNCIRLYDPLSGKVLRDLCDLTKEQDLLVFSPDSKVLATVNEKAAKFWELASGKMLKSFSSDRRCVLAFAPKGQLVALGIGKKIVLCDTATWTVRHAISGEFSFGDHTALCYLKIRGLGQPVTFSPDGQRLLATCGKTIRQWQVETGKEIVP